MRLLVRDLRLACRRDVLKDVLETASAVVVLSAKGDELAAAALARVRNLLAEPADPLADPWLAQRLRSFLATDPVLIAVKGWAREGRGRRSTG